MPKTNFQKGTIVEPEFLNSMYYTSGGHRHNGGSDDGCARRIVLSNAEDVTGQLPAANQGLHRHSGAAGQNQEKISLTDEVQGILPAANQGMHRHGEGNQSKIRLPTDVEGVLPLDSLPDHRHYHTYGAISNTPPFNGARVSFVNVFVTDSPRRELILVYIHKITGVRVYGGGSYIIFSSGLVNSNFRPLETVATLFSVWGSSTPLTTGHASFDPNGKLSFWFPWEPDDDYTITIPAFSFQFYNNPSS